MTTIKRKEDPAPARWEGVVNGHTPGPWKMRPSQDGSGDIGITANGLPNVLAECFAAIRYKDERSPEAAANARLIAAAPDMLSLLLQAAEWFQGYADGHTAKGDTDKAKRNQDRAGACRAAILKATGEQP